MNIKISVSLFVSDTVLQFYLILLTLQRTQIILKQYFNLTDRLVGWFIKYDN